MRHGKTILSIVMTVVLATGLMPASAIAVDVAEAGESGDANFAGQGGRELSAAALTDRVEFNGHYYKVYDFGLSWIGAYSYCVSQGGHLATITSEGEQSAIEDAVSEGFRNNYWLGGYMSDEDGSWLWITGEEFSYTHWAEDQPDNYSDIDESRLMMYRCENPNSYSELGEWNDLEPGGTCEEEDFFGLDNFGFICEWEPGADGSSDDGNEADQLMCMLVGADASKSVSDSDFVKFFPGSYKLKQTIVPVEFSRKVEEDGSVVYKLGIGIGRKDLLDKKSKWNQFKANVKAVKDGKMSYAKLKKDAKGKTASMFTPEKFKLSPEVGIMGYAELKYKDDKLVSKSSSIVAEAKWEAKADWQFATPIGPVYSQVKGGAKAKVEGKVEYEEASPLVNFDGAFTLEPFFNLEGGYGIASVATVGLQGSATLPMQVAPPTKASIKAKASLHAYLVFVIDSTFDLAETTIPLWDITTSSKSKKALGVSSSGYGGSLSEVDRSYARCTSAWSGDVGISAGGLVTQVATDGATAVLQESVMPNTLPLIGEAGEKKVMVFQQNDPARATLDSSVLVYSVLDDGMWSEPVPVWDTGTLDAYADLRRVGNDLYVAWQKEKRQIAGDVSQDAEGVLGDMAASSEICVARFDANSGTFMDARRVTDNDTLDMMPALVSGSDDLKVAYVRNTENAFDQAKGDTQVIVATEDGGSWSESTLADAAGYVSGITAFDSDEGADVAYMTIDADADAAGGSVYLARSGAMLSSAGEQPTALQWLDDKLYWVTDGLVKAYDCSSAEIRTLNDSVLAGDQAADEHAADAGDFAVVATESETSGTSVGTNMRVLSNENKTSVVWT